MRLLTGWLIAGCTTIWLAISPPVNGADAAPNPNATLVYFDVVSNQTLDPREPQNNSSFAQGPLMAIYDSLISFNPAGEPKPGLALSWQYNPDLTEITLKLRPGVTFHDGSKVDAAAVALNLQRSVALGMRAGAAVIETMNQIAAIETEGDDIVRLKLKAPNGQMPYLLGTQAGMMISPASLADDAFGSALKPVGAGPFKVRSFESNVRTTMERNDAYWGGKSERPAVIEHHFVSDGRARLNALRSGQANLALIEPRSIAEAKAAGLAVLVNEKNSTWNMTFNFKRETTGKLKLRQAILHAIDREALAEALGFGASQPTAQLFAQTSPMYQKKLDELYPFDQAKARKLLAEAGYPKGVDINWMLINTTEYRLLAEALQAMLGEVGIGIKFDTVDASQYVLFRRPPTRGDLLMVRWGGRPDPLQAFQEVVGTGGSIVPGTAVVPEVDTLIDKARRLDPANPERMKVLHELALLSLEQAAYTGIMTRSNVYAFWPGCISGIPAYLPTGNDRINDVSVAMGCK